MDEASSCVWNHSWTRFPLTKSLEVTLTLNFEPQSVLMLRVSRWHTLACLFHLRSDEPSAAVTPLLLSLPRANKIQRLGRGMISKKMGNFAIGPATCVVAAPSCLTLLLL